MLTASEHSQTSPEEELCFSTGDIELGERLNPDVQGRVMETIMEEGEQWRNYVVRSAKGGKVGVRPEDLRTILAITKDYGKNVNLDQLLHTFLQESKKNNRQDVDSRERFIMSLLHLKNGGMFVQAHSSAKIWKKTYYGKSSYRSNTNS
eukprot:TRINITY_DN10643_c0_g1_i5.p1 TRINITY_DN10643_c0_g1~~TRINITY_DN10643_c0_g1_i5.p1  ORF type:complete len:149 (+),score=48.32 TRINITY_DN10643_c0_g1_i5:706-1152(+)